MMGHRPNLGAAAVQRWRRALARMAWVAALPLACAGLDPFGAAVGKLDVGPRTVRTPYLTVLQYFGYLEPGRAGRERVGDGSMLPVYVWLPEATGELGVRVISPTRRLARPEPGKDFVGAAFAAHAAEGRSFDPAVAVERCSDAVPAAGAPSTCAAWVQVGHSLDAVTAFESHAGHDRAELRLGVAGGALARGLYRIGVADGRSDAGGGTFLLQLGAPAYLEGAAMATSMAALSGQRDPGRSLSPASAVRSPLPLRDSLVPSQAGGAAAASP